MANPQTVSAVDGIGYSDMTGLPSPAINANRSIGWTGQTGNTVAGTVADQQHGTAALPALSAGATGTVTITNGWITTASLIYCQVKRGTTTASAGAVATVLTALRPPTSGSCVVDVTNLGSAATLSTDYVIHYWIVN